MYAVKRQISVLLVEIILSQDGRTLRTELCWRTWSLGERTVLEYAERCTSPYLCKKDGYVRVNAVCNWQCGPVLGGMCAVLHRFA